VKDQLLSLFGVSTAVAGLLGVFGFLHLRSKAPARVAAASETGGLDLPAELAIAPTRAVQWQNPQAVRLAVRALVELGFEKLGAFQVGESQPMQIGVLARPDEGTCAVLAESGQQELSCEFLAGFSDGSALIVSNAPSRRGQAHPPSQRRIVEGSASINELHGLFGEALAEERFKEVEPVDVRCFEDFYAEIHKSAVAWRRANPDPEELPRDPGSSQRDAAADALSAPLFEAIAAQDPAWVDELLAKTPPLSGRDRQGRTPLVAAIATGKTDLVKLLLDAGADVNGSIGELSWPSRSKMVLLDPIAEAEAEVDPEAQDESEVERASTSAEVPRSAEIELSGCVRKLTPIEAAVETGCPAVVQQLLDAEAAVCGAESGAPLSLAAREGDPEVVQLLLDAGADLEARDACGRTPLMNACTGGFPEVAELLLEAGVDPVAKGEDGETAILCAAESGARVLVELLAARVGEPEGREALNVCAEHDLTEEQRNRDSRVRRLFEAASRGKLAAVDKLLAEGVAPDASEEEDEELQVTPLMIAAEAGELEVMQRLIEAGADVNRVAEGRTTIFRVLSAISMPRDRREAALEYLVGRGADLRFTDPQGRNAVKMAWESDDPGLVKVIERLRGE